MASLFSKIAKFASSPQGRKLMNKAKEMANDPHKRQQAKDKFDQLRNKRGGSGGTGSGGGTPPAQH